MDGVKSCFSEIPDVKNRGFLGFKCSFYADKSVQKSQFGLKSLLHS